MAIVYSKIVMKNHPISNTPLEVSRHTVDKVKSNSPNYGMITKLGQRLPENPYTTTVIKRYQPITRVNRRSRFGSGPGTLSPWYNQAPDFSIYMNPAYGGFLKCDVSSFANLEGKALSRLYDGASFYKTNVGLAVAEGRKTLSLITSTATRLANAYLSLRKFDIAGAAKALGLRLNPKRFRKLVGMRRELRDSSLFAAKAFLELSYGWVPLLSDLHSSAEDLARRNLTQNDDVVIRGVSSDTAQYLWKLGLTNSDPPNQDQPSTLTCSKSGPCDIKRVVSYKLHLRLANQTLRTRANLGLTNPLTLAWELLPFSFVIDWFSPIGTYLESLSAFSGLAFVDGSRTQFEKRRYNVQWSGNGNYGSSYTRTEIVGSMDYATEEVYLTRVKLSGIPAWRPEKWLTPLGVAVADRPLKALALLRAVMGK